MDALTRAKLNEINRQFYEITAEEFDQTRGRAWPGWEPLLEYSDTPLSVLDLGCGNGRFGVFLANALSGRITYHGIDNNPALLQFAQEALQPHLHLHTSLFERDIIAHPPHDGIYDLVTLFGVIHHVPGRAYRRALIEQLAQRVAPGGLLAIACWRFLEYERFRSRLVPWPPLMHVEAHDYLLDWRRGERAYRYCHYVDDAEEAELIHASGLSLVDRYRADGSDGRMNVYLLLQRDG